MPVDRRDKIFPNDSLVLIYECRMSLVSDTISFGQPVDPVSAFVRILDKETGTFIPLGNNDETELPLAIIPQSGDQGALLKYTIGSDVTNKVGDYTAYVTAIFADGTRLTEDRDFKVLDLA